MTVRIEIENLYQQYLEQADKAEKNRKMGEGLFGFGKKPSDDPCHTQFFEALQAIMQSYAESKPDSAELKEILAMIFRKPTEHRETASVYWMLLAAQGTTLSLIPLLLPEDAAELEKEYGKLYRRWERLPVQKDICKALKQAASA